MIVTQRTNRIITDENKEETETERIIEVIQNKERLNRYETKDNAQEMNRKDKICKHFSTFKECRFGDNCRYKHIRHV